MINLSDANLVAINPAPDSTQKNGQGISAEDAKLFRQQFLHARGELEDLDPSAELTVVHAPADATLVPLPSVIPLLEEIELGADVEIANDAFGAIETAIQGESVLPLTSGLPASLPVQPFVALSALPTEAAAPELTQAAAFAEPSPDVLVDTSDVENIARYLMREAARKQGAPIDPPPVAKPSAEVAASGETGANNGAVDAAPTIAPLIAIGEPSATGSSAPHGALAVIDPLTGKATARVAAPASNPTDAAAATPSTPTATIDGLPPSAPAPVDGAVVLADPKAPVSDAPNADFSPNGTATPDTTAVPTLPTVREQVVADAHVGPQKPSENAEEEVANLEASTEETVETELETAVRATSSASEGADDMTASGRAQIARAPSHVSEPIMDDPAGFTPLFEIPVGSPEPTSTASPRTSRAEAQQLLNEAIARFNQHLSDQTWNRRFSIDLKGDDGMPVRLTIQPDGDGQHRVAFLVAHARLRDELKRALPEIRDAVTHLPVDVSDVSVDAFPATEAPAPQRRPNGSKQ